MSDASDGDRAGGETEGRDRDREPTRSGRTLVLAVFVGCVSVAGGFGFFVGSIGPRALGSIAVFGVTVFQPTPAGMALYGMTITGLVLGIIYIGARIAVRREK